MISGAGKTFRLSALPSRENLFEILISAEIIGWVFPTRSIKQKACDLCGALGMRAHDKGGVVHLNEGKQQKLNPDTGEAERILPSPHRNAGNCNRAHVGASK